jgi:hypothetical protein
MYEGDEKNSIKNLKERKFLEGLGVDWWTILKSILKKM